MTVSKAGISEFDSFEDGTCLIDLIFLPFQLQVENYSIWSVTQYTLGTLRANREQRLREEH